MTSISSFLPNLSGITQGFDQLAQLANSPTSSPAQFQSLLEQLQNQMSGEPASAASTAPTAPSIATQAGGSNFNGTAGIGYSGYSGTVAVENQPTLSALPNTSQTSINQPSINQPSINQPSINQLGDAAASNALQYLGVPYTWGGTSPQTGFDCSGLVQRVYQNLGVALPRTAAEQSNVGTPVSSISQAVPGDLIFYGSPADHVGIYLGNGLMVNAPETGQTVSVTQVGTPTSIRHITSPSPSATTTASSLNSTFAAASSYYNLPPGLLSAVAKVESNYNPSAVSPAGAVGIMQIMPSTAQGMGINPADPVQAIFAAGQLLSEKLNHFGSVPLALAAYNAGDGAVEAAGGIPPYQETQNYISKVISTWQGGN